MINHIFSACLMLAAQTYSVPPQVLVGILHVEGGRIGQQVANKNGTYDLGPMQINSLWVPELAQNWKVSRKTAWKWLRDDGCTNVNVAAWILGRHLEETKSLAKAVAYYHSRTPHLGKKYKSKVVDVMRKKGLLEKASPNAKAILSGQPPSKQGKQPAKKIVIGRSEGEESKVNEDKG